MVPKTLRFRELLRRGSDALRRRAAYAWSRWATSAEGGQVEAAARWLSGPETVHWVPAVRGDAAGCPSTTAMSLGTARRIGLEGPIDAWLRWLVALQQPDGSLPASAHSSLWNTALFIRGIAAGYDSHPERGMTVNPVAIRAACGFVRSWVEANTGRQAVGGTYSSINKGLDRGYDRLTEFLLGLAAWRLSASHAVYGDVASCAAADAVAERTFSGRADGADLTDAGIVPEAWAWRIEAFRDLGRRDWADESLRVAAARQCRDGSLAERSSGGPASPSAIAHLASLWYRSGQREPADRAMRFLDRRREHWDSGTMVHYLDAAVARVAASFAATVEDFPDQIDPNDGRAEAVEGWFAALGQRAAVADVGCGKGRFLRLLAQRFPQARYTGIDVAAAMLAHVPPGVTPCRGSLLNLPLADGSFDGAFAVESLEHALLPERAVSELCRIVRRGGGVLVIDKHRARQPLSHHDPWERWFTPDELAEWLGRWCDDVVVRPVSHLEGRPGHSLFLAAMGRKR